MSYLSLPSLLPVFGIVSAIYQMVIVLKEFTLNGAGDPQLMSGGISHSLVPVVLTTVLAVPSIVCIFLVIFLTTYRSKVFFRIWVFSSLVLVLAFPFGTLFGLVLAIVLFLKRREFTNKPNMLKDENASNAGPEAA